MLLEQSGNVITGDEFKMRALGASEPTVQFLAAAGLVLDRIERTLDVPGSSVNGEWIAGRRIHLTPLEVKILEVLMRNAPKAIHRDVLLHRAWGIEFNPGTNRVDVAVRYLRQKLGTAAIETVRGVGYRIRELSA